MTMLANGEQAAMKQAGIADYEARIRIYKEQAVSGFLGIGKTLNEAQASGLIPRGQWESWVEKTTGMAIRQAQRCMQAAREIAPGSALERLDMSKALLLLSSGLETEQKEELAARAAEDGSSVRALQDEIKRLKLEKVQEAGAAAEIRTALKKAEGERDQLAGQMDAAVKAVKADAERRASEAYERGAKDQAGLNTEALARANGVIDKYEKEQKKLKDEKTDLMRQLKEMQETLQDEYGRGRDEAAGERSKLRGQVDDLLEEREKLRAELREKEEAARKARNRDGLEKEIREDVRKEYAGKIDFLNSQRRQAEERAKDLEAELESSRKDGSAQWDKGYQAGVDNAVETYRKTDGEKNKSLVAQQAALEEELKAMRQALEDAEKRAEDKARELEAAEEREAKRARELAEIRKDQARQRMDAARGIRADAMNGLDLAAAVRAFIGAAGTLPQMGREISGMSEKDRAGIRAQVETVAEWVRSSRAALGAVVAEATVV